MPAPPTAQWKLDNLQEFEDLLKSHVASLEMSGDQLRIRGPAGLEIILDPGDCLIREGDRLGTLRVPEAARATKRARIIEVRCEHCDKPIEVEVDVLQDPATIWVVCSNECKEAIEFGLLVSGQTPPPSGLKH